MKYYTLIFLVLSLVSLGQTSFLPNKEQTEENNYVEINDLPKQQKLGRVYYERQTIYSDAKNHLIINIYDDMYRAQQDYDYYGRQNVQAINFNYDNTNVRNISDIFNFLSNKSQPLENIVLSFNYDKINDISGIQKMQSIPSLTDFQLYLAKNPIDNSGLQQISNTLIRQPYLKQLTLGLGQTWITNFDNLYKALSKQSHLLKLEVDLNNLLNKINGPFGFNVTLSSRLNELYLGVSGNEISGFQYLDNIVNQKPRNLQILTLDVASSNYNDQNINNFQKLAQIKSLKKLYLVVGKVSSYYRRQLSDYLVQNLPGCEVYVNGLRG